jgi:hypothetical protein
VSKNTSIREVRKYFNPSLMDISSIKTYRGARQGGAL